MNVLITGGAGTVGTAITDELTTRDEYSITSVDLEEHPDSNVESVVADVTDYDEIRPYFDEKDALIHLAHTPLETGGQWERTIRWTDAHGKNIQAHANVIGDCGRH